MSELASCELPSICFVSLWSCLFGGAVARLAGRCERKLPRASIVVTCDVVKVLLGTTMSFAVLIGDESFNFSQLLWRLLIKSLLIVGGALPIALLLWRWLVRVQRRRVADGLVARGSVLRALQASGRYNPRQRMGLEDEDCLDYRVDEESATDDTGASVVAVAAIPLMSWWAVQTSFWILLCVIVSACISGIQMLVAYLLPTLDPPRAFAKALEHVAPLGCGEGTVGWAVYVPFTMVLAAVTILVADRFHRYHGRVAHRALTSPNNEEGTSSF